MNAGEGVRLDLVGVENFRQFLNLDEWLFCFGHWQLPRCEFTL
jgi:hypothetical protein